MSGSEIGDHGLVVSEELDEGGMAGSRSEPRIPGDQWRREDFGEHGVSSIVGRTKA